MSVLALVFGLVGLVLLVQPSLAAESDADEVVLVEPSGKWHIRVPDPAAPTTTTSIPTGNPDYTFWYGMSGDVPLMGDWDGDGYDTPGMYRPSNGFVYLTNTIPTNGGVGSGDPTLTFFFGMAGDQVVVGDWDGDGVDTLGIRRNGRMYLINRNATGVADVDFWFGHPNDIGFGGDADGDGGDSVFVYRPQNGLVYYTNAMPVESGTVADTAGEFFFGIPTDRFVIGDWNGDGGDTVGAYRPNERRVYLRNTLNTGPATEGYVWGQPTWVPVAGHLNVQPPRLKYRLEVIPSEGGTVTSHPGGINNCSNTNPDGCVFHFTHGSVVTLTPTPDVGYEFSGWSDDSCSGFTGPCTVLMVFAGGDRVISPAFRPTTSLAAPRLDTVR